MSIVQGGTSVLASLWSGVSGIHAFSAALDTASYNIANLNTVGFKQSHVSFADIFSDALTLPNTLGSSQAGQGVRVNAIRTDFTQGVFETTTNPLDLGIDGPGFFIVRQDAGAPELYTRAGAFDIGQDATRRDGFVVNPGGLLLQVDQAGAIGELDLSVEGLKTRFGDDFVLESVSVDESGLITASALSGRVEELGTIPLARFDDPGALIPVGENLYTQSFSSGIPSDVTGSGRILQNVLELSNVDLSEQFVELIKFQRAFQINNRVVGTSDEIYQQIVDLKS